MHEHEWERGAHMAEAFGVDGRTYACAICGERRPGTDHGGAASPRTEPMYEVPGSLLDELRERRRAAQEAPAPEGLRAALLEAAHERDFPDNDLVGFYISVEDVERILATTPPTPAEPPRTYPGHRRVMHEDGSWHYEPDRAEARPPEGLDAAWNAAEAAALASPQTGGQYQLTLGVNGRDDKYRAWAQWTWDEGGEEVADGPTPAAALTALAARLSAGGATKP